MIIFATLVAIVASISLGTGFTGIAGKVTGTLAEAGTGGTIQTGAVAVTLIGGPAGAGIFTMGAKVAIQTFLTIGIDVPVAITATRAAACFAVATFTVAITLVAAGAARTNGATGRAKVAI